ncbi:MAG: hypothetical protein J0H54_00815 [Rhizobiales bacterium]|nr:hypothetical protein [Hyphomicrobiales bacterium]
MPEGFVISFENDWLWGVPLVVITVIFHVMGLGLLDRGVTMLFATKWFGRASLFRFVVITGLSAFVATFLHAVEAVIWAYSYILIGALPGPRVAMFYSLNAITSLGHDNIFLPPAYALLGPIESLNGIMLFGLTTAFLFAILQRVWFLGQR